MSLLLWALLAAPARAQSVPAKPVIVTRACSPAAWKKLRDRALRKPDSRQTVQLDGADYTISSLISSQPFPLQDCPAGTQPKNAVYFTAPAPAKGEAPIYPVRLTAGCVKSPDGAPARELLSVDLDWDGNILDISLYDAALGILVHPAAEPVPVPGDTQTSNLETVLSRLVKFLTEAP